MRFKRIDWTTFRPAPVIGVDEAGRGCLAGPVVAAAVIMSEPNKRRLFYDSKLLSEDRREKLYNLIISKHRWCVGIASVEEIDRINILQASLLAMRRAVEGLGLDGGHVLVDGKFTIPGLGARFKQTPFVKGDGRLENISAASLVAKVTRDRLMRELDREFPAYGFQTHKGYGTSAHRRVLAQMGACQHHRKSFSGVLPEAAEELES